MGLMVYQYDKRAGYWGRHVENAMQPVTISPAPSLAEKLEPLFHEANPVQKKPYTLYHFWATWCAPCRAEIPTLNALQKRFGNDLQVVTISADENKEDVLRFFAEHAPPFQVLWDQSQKVSQAWGVQKFPESFLVGPDGKTAIRFSGARDWSSREAVDYLNRLFS
jgi:thiol-disulfide isomerase/thioredoxin